MNAKPVVAARVVAWFVSAGGVVAVIVGYDSLPPILALTRWTGVPKSPFVALRVPLINLLTVGLIELLSPGLQRAKDLKGADVVVAVLLFTAAAKAGTEVAAILTQPVSFSWVAISLIIVLSAGLGAAAFLGRDFLQPKYWRNLRMTWPETLAALTLISGIVVLNIPLVMR